MVFVCVVMIAFHLRSTVFLVATVSAVVLARYLFDDAMDSKPKPESV